MVLVSLYTVLVCVVVFFFFFQAEDGIRDVAVTGVQTCALPISVRGGKNGANGGCGPSTVVIAWCAQISSLHSAAGGIPPTPIAPMSASSTIIGRPPEFQNCPDSSDMCSWNPPQLTARQ